MGFRSRCACVALAAVGFLQTRDAAADEVPSTQAPDGLSQHKATATTAAPPPEAATTTEWYGWQILIADVSSIAVAGAGTVLTQNAAPAVIGSVGFLAAGPITHAAHDRPRAALGSLGLRVGLGAAGGLVGGLVALISGPKGTYPFLTTFAYAGVGAGVGLVAASVIDIAWLSHVPVKANVAGQTVQWRPMAGATPQGAQIGVAGSF